ncbi:hypothetical protein [Streptomyces sp. CB03911]|uniref:hypothetical protein n=1 Tax=Streptomycetaceae TaxID=2062 RepID=UPI0005B912EF|nr:hypothetical protein [Streptomyces sp. CB03911]OKI24401.1 hypothetical protein A6A07_05945 [Streptomyces sp. CB03911]
MAKSPATDIAGVPITPGAVIVYAARLNNRVRLAEGVVTRVSSALVGGRVVPFLRVRPTGNESGFVKRRCMREVNITTEHVAVTVPPGR